MDNIKLQKSYNHLKYNSHYHQKLLDLINKREKFESLKKYRKHIIDAQNKLNYQGEYDRLRSYLSNRSILPPSTVEFLEKRKKFLEGLKVGENDKII